MTNQEMLQKVLRAASESATPGLEEFAEERPTIKAWWSQAATDLFDKVRTLPDEDYEVLGWSFVRGVRKAARLHSEAEWARWQAEDLDVLDLDLRFGRYVHFHVGMSDAHGKEYRLYGLPPLTTPPPGVYWGTCQDWLNALAHDAAIDMVRVFGRLPCNERYIDKVPGSVVTTVDTTRSTEEGRPMIKTTKVKREQLGLF